MNCFVKYIRLQCNETTESGEDEVFIKYNGTKIWPSGSYYDIDKGDSVDLVTEIPDLSKIEPGKQGHIEVMEYDSVGSNDKIGEVWPDETMADTGRRTAVLTGDGGNYDFTYEVISM